VTTPPVDPVADVADAFPTLETQLRKTGGGCDVEKAADRVSLRMTLADLEAPLKKIFEGRDDEKTVGPAVDCILQNWMPPNLECQNWC
jgi:hypothetical protein